MPATISVNFATQSEVENSPQPTNKSVSAKVLADVLGGGSLGGGYVRIAGSTMTGPLTLNAAPTQNLHAATKKYVDDNAYTTKFRYNIGTATSTISPATPAEANGRTLDFVSTLNLDVYRNGVLLVGDGVDYTANVATKTITFNTELGVGAVVQVNVGGVGSILANPGVMQIQAGTGISLNPAGGTGTVTVTNNGVTQITAGTGISVNNSTGNVTVSVVDPIPAGTIAMFASPNPPSGWLTCNGALLDRTAYARLFAYAQASGNYVTDAIWNSSALYGAFSSGTTASNFRIPWFLSQFLRMHSSSTGTFGRYESDAIRNIVGYLGTVGNQPASVFGASFSGALFSYSRGNCGGAGGGGVANNCGSIGFEANRSVPVASENRPVNITVNYCIKF